ncbi:hypothetical protein [uncultured Clostridium sp.]|uniref:hypothetical protein n=1 Tax=uncultured Clostridium sp. TaxID=59620 RepID=UPI0026054371|nr:hypothetical protein [uncultured Clostridium sp.]
MRTKTYKVYIIEEIENSLCEKVKDFVFLKNVELFIFKKGKIEAEKQGIDTETTIYNALAYNLQGLENGMFVEINKTKYRIKDLTDFGHKVFFLLEE